MAYEKQTWKTGDVITAEKLNHIEEGIANAKSSASIRPKHVNFIDYDGTLVDSYDTDEFLALDALPENPSHDGLVAQGWNWSLAKAKNYVEKYGSLNVGQMYTTDTGDTRIYIHIDEDTPQNRLTFYVRFTSSVADNVDIDWGDGTVETKGDTTATNYQHEYAIGGDYVIKLKVNTGTISFEASSSYAIYGKTSDANSGNRGRIRKIEIGNNVSVVGEYAFQYCYSLTSITIPDGVTSLGNSVFTNCSSLASITIPDSVTSLGSSVFAYCYSIKSITIPDGVTSLGNSVFTNCSSLASITIPDSVTSLGSSVFTNCYSIKSITIQGSVTSLGSSVFAYCSSLASITIPDSVTSLGSSVFTYCSSLASITIPDGVTSFGSYVFTNCYGISEYHLLATTPPRLTNSNAFSGIANDCKIYVPYSADHSILNAYKTATGWSDNASRIYEEAV